MALSHELISQFAKVVNNDKTQSTETTIYGTVVDKNGHKPGDVDDKGNKIVIDENGGKYIKPDGSDQLIPITENEEDPAKANTTTRPVPPAPSTRKGSAERWMADFLFIENPPGKRNHNMLL